MFNLNRFSLGPVVLHFVGFLLHVLNLGNSTMMSSDQILIQKYLTAEPQTL